VEDNPFIKTMTYFFSV